MKLTARSFESRTFYARAVLPFIWIPLGFLLLVPVLGNTPLIPWNMNNWPLLERGVPIAWLMVAGSMVLFSRLSQASIPFSVLMAWCFIRTAMADFPVRPIQIMLLMLTVGALYVAARSMSTQHARLFMWSLSLGVSVELVLGYLNIFKIYPWMSWVVPDQVGRAMGLLTHPNYWGSLMALALPAMWSLVGPVAVVAIMVPVVLSYSAGPVISALAGIVVCAWPELGKKMKYLLIAGSSAVAVGVMQVHEWRLNGRREIWQAIWPEILKYPFKGQGLGDWRVWADHYNHKISLASGKPEVFASLQAHNEIYQVLFELGLIGVAIVGYMALQAAVCSIVVWKHQTHTQGWYLKPIGVERAWLAVVVVACVNSLVSPTFHLPAQAAIAMFALARVQYHAVRYETLVEEAGNKVAGKGRRKGKYNA